MRGRETEPAPEQQDRKTPGRRLRKNPNGPFLWAGIGIATAILLAAGVWARTSGQQAETPEGESEPPVSEGPELDTNPPQLLGVKDITVTAGGTISYRDGVSALDDVDGTVPFQVDAGAVDLTTPGVYQVIYSARDAAGNQAQAAAAVTVEEPFEETLPVEGPNGEGPVGDEDPSPAPSGASGTAGSGSVSPAQATLEDVNKLADQILAKITNSNMSQREKARAIYNYVYNHIKYTGTSDKSSWIIGAYTGFTRQRGDCYNYFACSKALLTRAGIPNIDLQRVGGTTRHYWQLVNVGSGWYHFDTCWKPTGYPLNAFLITEAQARAYTKKLNDAGVRKNYYVYDYDSCPVQVVGTPEEDPSAEPSVQPPVTEAPPEVTLPPTEDLPEVTPPPTEDLPDVTPSPTEDIPESTQPLPEETDPPAENPTQQPPEPPPAEPPADSQPEGQPDGGE